MVLLRIVGLLLLSALVLFGLWVAFVNVTGREKSIWYGGRPSTLGVKNGTLSGPKATPNTVLSDAVESTSPAYVAPLVFTGDPRAALAKLGTVLQGLNRVKIVALDETYLHAEFRSKTLRYVDDFEARVDAAAGVIHIRSASRLGRSDLGVNRARVEMIREKFTAS
jgi:uncharacterized protein (DUF1499 family)